MARVLAWIRSRFILSINDHPDIRKIFKEFEIRPVSLKYTVSKNKQITGRELLVSNF